MRLLLRGAAVFDGDALRDGTGDVLISDGTFARPDGRPVDREIDLTGWTVAPGFFDCHVHVNRYLVDLMSRLEHPFSYQFYAAADNLSRTLDLGITTVRDAGGADLGTKTAQEDGLIRGSRLMISVAAIGPTGGHTDAWKVSGARAYHWMPHPGRPLAMADGEDEMRRTARELMRAGADTLKVCASGGVMSVRDSPHHEQFSDGEMQVLVNEAARLGKHVMAHAQGSAGIEQAVKAGVRSIEHGTFLSDRAIELMLERGTWLVPTMVASLSILDAVAQGVSLPQRTIDKAHEGVAAHADSLRRASEAGVRIAMGTDAGVSPHGKNLRELEEMVGAGMPSLDVLRATTSSAAELLEMDDRRGRIRDGYAADLVAYRGDALDLTGLESRVGLVIQDGRIEREDLAPEM